MNCTKAFLKRVNLTIFEVDLLVKVNAVGQEQMQHLGEIILQLAGIFNRLLNLNHGLPNVAEMVLITFQGVLVRSSLELFKLREVLMSLLSFSHIDLGAERF